MAAVLKKMIFLAVTLCCVTGPSQAQPAPAPAAPAPAAPAPGPAFVNLTAILEKAGQFTTFMSLLKSTQVGNQLQIQLNSSNQGLTIFAPSDAAFAALKPGTLNSISDQQKMALLQYHALPSYFTFGQFQTVSNPVRTMASGNGGPFGINVTAFGSSVNVSTGVMNTPLANAVYSQNPVAVYEVDKVLLPKDIFGAKPPAAAPAPEAGAPISSPIISPSSDSTGKSDSSGCRSGMVVSKGVVVGVFGLVVAALL